MKRRIAALSALILSSTSFANTYTGIANAGLQKFDDWNTYDVSGDYYFDGITSVGPKDYFGFNSRNNFIGASYASSDTDYSDTSSFAIRGQYNYGIFQLTASHTRSETDASFGNFSFETESTKTGLNLQVFINENWGIGAATEDLNITGNSNDFDAYLSTTSHFYTNYKHQIGDKDTLGFKVIYLDSEQEFLFDIEHMKHFDGGQFLKTSLLFDDDLTTIADVEYYFSSDTALAMIINDLEFHAVEFSHFFNDNLQVKLGISGFDYDEQAYSANLVGYF